MTPVQLKATDEKCTKCPSSLPGSDVRSFTAVDAWTAYTTGSGPSARTHCGYLAAISPSAGVVSSHLSAGAETRRRHGVRHFLPPTAPLPRAACAAAAAICVLSRRFLNVRPAAVSPLAPSRPQPRPSSSGGPATARRFPIVVVVGGGRSSPSRREAAMPAQQPHGLADFRYAAHSRRPRAAGRAGLMSAAATTTTTKNVNPRRLLLLAVVLLIAAAASSHPARPEQRPEVGPGRTEWTPGALQQPLLQVLAGGRLQSPRAVRHLVPQAEVDVTLQVLVQRRLNRLSSCILYSSRHIRVDCSGVTSNSLPPPAENTTWAPAPVTS